MDKPVFWLNFMYSMERFAAAVYRGQRGGFKEAFISRKMDHAVENEWQHASNLKQQIIDLQKHPAHISAVFQITGSILGYGSRYLGRSLALKTDVVIEKRAVKDYGYFLRTLKLDEKTKQLITKIIADEEEHIKNWLDSITLVKKDSRTE